MIDCITISGLQEYGAVSSDIHRRDSAHVSHCVSGKQTDDVIHIELPPCKSNSSILAGSCLSRKLEIIVQFVCFTVLFATSGFRRWPMSLSLESRDCRINRACNYCFITRYYRYWCWKVCRKTLLISRDQNKFAFVGRPPGCQWPNRGYKPERG